MTVEILGGKRTKEKPQSLWRAVCETAECPVAGKHTAWKDHVPASFESVEDAPATSNPGKYLWSRISQTATQSA